VNKAIIILFLLVSNLLFGQNLVPNPSFEIYTSCPSAGGQLNLAIPWIAIPTNDVEYFNSCSTDTNFSVPYQGGYNFQLARSGNAYAGIYTFLVPNLNYREYLQVQLTLILQVNLCYFVEFYVNRTNSSFGGKYASNNIGCSFTDTAVNNTGTGNVLTLPPHILPNNNPIIVDTLSWVKISGIYVANGGEKFITIGNFFNDASTDTIDMNAYYLIDDVSVIPIDSIPGGMPANAGIDTNVTLGDSVFIGQEISNLNCNWYDSAGTLIASNTSGIFVQPTASTYYVVEQNLCGVITYDTVYVVVLPNSINEINNEHDIIIHPNPTSTHFTIEGLYKPYNLTIYNSIGQLLYTENKVLETSKQVDVSKYNKGLLFIRIEAEGEVYYHKIIKE
jgi:hypothetical protein